jgi:nitroimidazol reductase NimA-like FMN-containing flavoprotein (pyridoxamine 5'-phosphate oxidase superfamily)
MTIDELEQYGMERMDAAAIEAFLTDQSTGILGLPTEDLPYMLPLSYVFDEDEHLYFTYLLGETSRKQDLTERAARARFLVYEVETTFTWKSVVLTGELSVVPEDEWDDLSVLPSNAWRPSVLQSATTSGGVAVYEFAIEDVTGIRQTGLAPDFRENIEP